LAVPGVSVSHYNITPALTIEHVMTPHVKTHVPLHSVEDLLVVTLLRTAEVSSISRSVPVLQGQRENLEQGWEEPVPGSLRGGPVPLQVEDDTEWEVDRVEGQPIYVSLILVVRMPSVMLDQI